MIKKNNRHCSKMGKLRSPKCAEEKRARLVIIVDSHKKGRCYEREELQHSLKTDGRDPLTGNKFDRSSYELLANFPYEIFQEYYVKALNAWVLSPLTGTIEQYIQGLLTDHEITAKHQQTVQLGEGTFGRILQYGDTRPVVTKLAKSKITEDLTMIKELAVGALLYGKPCCLSRTYGISFNNDLTISITMKKYDSDLEKAMTNSAVKNVKDTFFRLVKAMYYANQQGLMHLDIKPPNVLVDDDGNADMADWGLGTFIPYQRGTPPDFNIMTPTYRSPEVFLNRSVTPAADVYSLGLIGYELYYDVDHTTMGIDSSLTVAQIHAKYPLVNVFFKGVLALYGITTVPDLAKTDMNKLLTQPIYLKKLPAEFRPIVKQMTCNLANSRPTYSEILNNPYFDDLRGDEKFPEITVEDVLFNIPVFQINQPSGDPLLKYNALIRTVTKVNPACLMTVFVMLSLFNRSIQQQNKLNDLLIHMEACYAIATSLILPFGHAPASQAVVRRIPAILEYLEFNLFGGIPILYFQNLSQLTEQAILLLLAYELAPIQPFHPQQVAKYIGNDLKILYFDKGYQYPQDQTEVCAFFASLDPDQPSPLAKKMVDIVPKDYGEYNWFRRDHRYDGSFV